uniref:Replication-associated protein ORF2/G2P domain-containing protein n=1 Tax=Prevotella sp. GTC17262 TaxID=3236797 RepID=A0AB33JJ44_9BACT
MHIVSCLHPQRIYNRYLDRYMYVPCRKCDACRNAYMLQWQQRLVQECRQHKYVYFFTLTYDEENVPLLHTYEMGATLANDDLSIVIDTSKYSNYENCKIYLDSREDFPVVSRKDVQDFVKRFRSNSSYLLRKAGKNLIENEKVRYFVCSEYGPRTYRAHYHGLFFFDSATISANFRELLSKSWRKGYSSFSQANNARCKYVAKYVSGISSLPEIYGNRSIAPFFLSSKKPAIASGCYGVEECKELYTRAESTLTIYDGRKYVDVPLWRNLENRLFPKCRGFSNLSHSERVALYGISSGQVICQKGKSFKIVPYDCVKTPLFPVDCNGERSCDLQLYRMSSRILSMCRLFGVTLDDYVTQIEIYYAKKDYRLLKQQLEFEEVYSFNHSDDVPNLLCLDSVFLDSVFSDSHHLNASQRSVLRGFGVNPDDVLDYRKRGSMMEKLSYSSSFDYLEMRSLHDKIIRDSVRSKCHNDYNDYERYKSVNYHHIY